MVGVEPGEPISCVIYAAKSSQDRKGSISGQIAECRAAIDADAGRSLVGEYTDESFSAFRSNRGPGLVEAMQHAEDLAREHGEAEMWAQHSDRLARGDGRRARHAVEIALWALKRDVRVRTIQDPGTFRDLLYAVVVGQRNNEDSRRKGLASSAGRRRAVERGDFIGYRPDGYRIAVDVDEHAAITKRMEVDPERQPVIEMIFSLALSGARPGVTARALNDAGFMTKPLHRTRTAKSWDVRRVIDTLKNPRYAGLAIFDGEIVARDAWPAYITERQHLDLKARMQQRRPTKQPRQLESYLLARLAICGRCGSSLYALTGQQHADGTFARRYMCASHRSDRHAGRCPAKAIEADVLEAMFVSVLETLLLGDSEQHAQRVQAPLGGRDRKITATERGRLFDAILAGDEQQLDAELDQLLTRMRAAASKPRHTATSGRRARQLEQIATFHAWAEQERLGRTEASRAETPTLNRLLRIWFTSIAVDNDQTSIDILAERRTRADESPPASCTMVRINRPDWFRSDPLARRPPRPRQNWNDAEILGALQAWSDAHQRSPTPKDWMKSSPPASDPSIPQHPTPSTVRAHFGSWPAALTAASLEHTDGRRRR